MFVTEGAEFDVVKFYSDSDGTKVVVKFADKESSKSFVEVVITSSDAEGGNIKAVDFVPGGCSFSPSLALSTLTYFTSYLLFF